MKRLHYSKGCLYIRLKQSLLDEGAGSGKACPIAKDSRIPADRPLHPGRGRFTLQACLSFPAGLMYRFKKQESGQCEASIPAAGATGIC